MKSVVLLNPYRDVPVLHFLWQWKLVSFPTIAAKFFPDLSERWAYNRLRTLVQANMIEMKQVGGQVPFAFTLGRRGYAEIAPRLPALKQEGYGSEHLQHDTLVTALHLGDFLFESPEGVSLCTEQELRRLHEDLLPDWVPRSERHRPDGYWQVPSGSRNVVIALEVELTRKDPARYEAIGAYYDSQPGIARVLWMVPLVSTACSIQASFRKSAPASYDKHDFIVEADFIKHGWEAQVRLGKDLHRSVTYLLTGNDQKRTGNTGKTAGNYQEPVSSSLLLDGRKSPKKQSDTVTKPLPIFATE